MNDEDLIVVCIRADEPSPWKATNLVTSCAWCGVAVQYRPHAPNAPKVCVQCFADRAEPDDDYFVTRTTVAEVLAELGKN
jgi:hypothetical protein